MSAYKILVCPVCAEQMAEPDYENGSDTHRHDGISVEPIEVAVELDRAAYNSKAGLARFRMQGEIRKTALREAERAWYRKLPKEERDRAEAERLRYMSPEQRAFENIMRDGIRDLNRQAFGSFMTVPTKETD